MLSTTLRNLAVTLLNEKLQDETYFQENYKLENDNKINKGGYGRVYKVKNTIGVERAIKEVKLDFEEDYDEGGSNQLSQRDATLLSTFYGCIQECLLKDTFTSPYIVKVYESWIQPSNQTSVPLLVEDVKNLEEILSGQPQALNLDDKRRTTLEKIKGYSIYTEMDWYEMNLTKYQDNHTESARLEWKTIVQSLDSALGHIHSKGWAHRDLKPDNILVNMKADVLDVALCDFGNSIHYKEDETAGTLPWKYVGTIPYNSAPEAARYEKCASAFDMWSLGFVMLRLFCHSDSELINDLTTDDKLDRMKLESWYQEQQIDSEALAIISLCLEENVPDRGKAGSLPGLDIPSN